MHAGRHMAVHLHFAFCGQMQDAGEGTHEAAKSTKAVQQLSSI